ncbi:hypothetical protein [Demequina gelatinilytica]|uniref:hypothetical protein n=1 Tax=Demequina gelatinilytica TaxID=1638980 RepID=UPI0007848F64|nr:hypothetical protein [Demequina gelatinilytica]
MGRTTATVALVVGACALGLAGCTGDGDAPPIVDEVASGTEGADTTGVSTDDPSGEATDAATGGDAEVCALVDAADLEEITGLAFDEGIFDAELSSDLQHVCNWTHTGDTLAIVQVLVLPGVGDAVSQRDSAEEWLGETADVDVAGATDAYSVAAGSIVGMRVGDDFLQVSYMSADPSDVTATTVAIAEVAVANL